MPISNSRLSYSDCFTLLDGALADPKGARVCIGEYGQAIFFRMRVNQARAIDRKDNKEIYSEVDHPLHGRSIYDPILTRVLEDTDGQWWVYAIKTELDPSRVEGLSELENE